MPGRAVGWIVSQAAPVVAIVAIRRRATIFMLPGWTGKVHVGFSSGAAMIDEDFGPSRKGGVRVLATEGVGRIACDARVLRLREHVRARLPRAGGAKRPSRARPAQSARSDVRRNPKKLDCQQSFMFTLQATGGKCGLAYRLGNTLTVGTPFGLALSDARRGCAAFKTGTCAHARFAVEHERNVTAFERRHTSPHFSSAA